MIMLRAKKKERKKFICWCFCNMCYQFVFLFCFQKFFQATDCYKFPLTIFDKQAFFLMKIAEQKVKWHIPLARSTVVKSLVPSFYITTPDRIICDLLKWVTLLDYLARSLGSFLWALLSVAVKV